jgi:hypothetical protein
MQDYFGGEILKTRIDGQWHFYNCIEGQNVDFTSSQFTEPIAYQNLPSNRQEAWSDTNAEQYEYLSEVWKTLADG